MTGVELIEALRVLVPVVSDEGVVTLEDGEEREVPLPPGCTAFLSAHPEGSNRGDYCPTVKLGANTRAYYHADCWELRQR